ncbi:MAG: hypothetical protein LUD78_00155 [Clostridiales bacterium]|nr:hypothetical protein [Clostridiales bacterium]
MDLRAMPTAGEPFELADGQIVNLRLNFGLLYKLKTADRAAYNRFYAAYGPADGKEKKDAIFAMVDIVYSAYLCGCFAEKKEPMEYEDFLMLLPDDMDAVIRTGTRLVSPKKNRDSARRSNPALAETETE